METRHLILQLGSIRMTSVFPHRAYLSAAVALAVGGYAMSAAVISGDPAAFEKLIEAYLDGFRIAVFGVVGYGLYSYLRED